MTNSINGITSRQALEGLRREAVWSPARVAGLLWLTLWGGLLAGGMAVAEEYHDNVVIVLDASGSMRQTLRGSGGSKMDAAKAALKEVLRTVPESTHVGLLVFSAKNLRDDWVYPLGRRDEEALMKAIDLPQPNEGTPLGAYIKKGADRLLVERQKQYGYGSYRLLVVTDGEAGDTPLVEKYTPEVMARGITMDVIGVGMKQSHTLATKVHSYRGANDPAALKQAIAEVFAEVSNSGTDEAANEAFEVIAPIPVDLASAIVQALATSGNEPIGQKARARGGKDSRVESPGQSARSSAPVTRQPAPRKEKGRSKVGTMVVILVVIMVVMKIVKRARR